MATTTPLSERWNGGAISDTPPHLLKENQAARLLNLLPDWFNAPLAIRAGWTYGYAGAADLTGTSPSSTRLSGIGYVPFSDGAKILAVDQSGRIISINTSGVASLLAGTGLATSLGSKVVYHLDTAFLFGDNGTTFPWKVTTNGSGTATATATVDPFPKGKVGASWGGYLLVANGGDFAAAYAQKPRRLWFSDAGLLTFTAANNSYWDFPGLTEIMGVFPMSNTILVFGPRSVEALVGTAPTVGTAASDFHRIELYPYGLCDRNAAKVWNGYVIFANDRGVFKTDGTSLVNITEQVGLSQQWITDMQQFGAGWTCALGLYQDIAFVTISNGSRTEVATYNFDLGREIGWNSNNFATPMYAEVSTGAQAAVDNSQQDLLFARPNLAQFGRVQPSFSTGGVAGKDGNNIPVEWDLQTAFYMMGGLEAKRVKRAYWTYLWDATAPYTDTVDFQYRVSNDAFQAIAWTTVTSPPNGTPFRGRQPIFIRERARWVQYRIHGGVGSAGTKNFAIYGLDVEGHANEGSRSSSR